MSARPASTDAGATRRGGDIERTLLRRRPGFVPEWRPAPTGVDHAMTEVLVRFIRTIGDRLDQAPAKYGLAMLDLLGVRLIPARAARAPIVFTLANSAQDARIPAGTRVAAPPPPGSNDQVIFELEEATGVAVAKLVKVVSVWPGRDQYIDHTPAATAALPFRPFARADLEDAPHAIYIAHPTMLALSGTSRIDLSFELTTAGSERLDIVWEFWDGKLWREFSGSQLDCDDSTDDGGRSRSGRRGDQRSGGGRAAGGQDLTDGTGGFTRSGSVHLRSDGGKAKPTTVSGVESYWVRGRLDQPLPPDPARILPEIDRVRLTTQIARPLDLHWTPPAAETRPGTSVDHPPAGRYRRTTSRGPRRRFGRRRVDPCAAHRRRRGGQRVGCDIGAGRVGHDRRFANRA